MKRYVVRQIKFPNGESCQGDYLTHDVNEHVPGLLYSHPKLEKAQTWTLSSDAAGVAYRHNLHSKNLRSKTAPDVDCWGVVEINKLFAEIRENPKAPGTYSLYVDGELKIREETMTVCSNVKEYLEHPERWDTSECCEVAESIRKSMS